MNLDNLSNLSNLLPKLQALGLSGEQSLEQFVNMAQVATPELAEYLGVEVSELVDEVSNSMSSAAQIPMQALNIIKQGNYSLGADVTRIPPMNNAPSLSLPPASVQATVNMINDMPPIRNQKNRGTCVAHAALSASEKEINCSASFKILNHKKLFLKVKKPE